MIEKHYTHSRFQFSVFTKSLFYMLLNILIIPGITLSTASKIEFFNLFIVDSVFSILKDQQITNIPEILSKFFLTNSGKFYFEKHNSNY